MATVEGGLEGGEEKEVGGWEATAVREAVREVALEVDLEAQWSPEQRGW